MVNEVETYLNLVHINYNEAVGNQCRKGMVPALSANCSLVSSSYGQQLLCSHKNASQLHAMQKVLQPPKQAFVCPGWQVPLGFACL
jgi:hypothetical protein